MLTYQILHRRMSSKSTPTTSSKRVKARCALLGVRLRQREGVANVFTYFNRGLLKVAKILRLAACALTLPTTLAARSGTRVASIRLASLRLFDFSAADRGLPSRFIWPPGHMESLRRLRYLRSA